MRKGVKIKKRRGGVRGSEVAQLPQPYSPEGAIEEPAVPLLLYH